MTFVRCRPTVVRPRWPKSPPAGPLVLLVETVKTSSTSSASGWAASRSAAMRLVTPGAMPAFMTTVPRAVPASCRRHRPASAGMAETLMTSPPRSSIIFSAVSPGSGTVLATTSASPIAAATVSGSSRSTWRKPAPGSGRRPDLTTAHLAVLNS